MKETDKDYWALSFTSESLYSYLPWHLFNGYIKQSQANRRHVQERLRGLPKKYRKHFLTKIDPRDGPRIAALLVETFQNQAFNNNLGTILKLVDKDSFKALLEYQYIEQAFHILKILYLLRRDSKRAGRLFQECYRILPQMRGGAHLPYKERLDTIRIHQAIYLQDEQLITESHSTGVTCYLKDNPEYRSSITDAEFGEIKKRYERFFILFSGVIPDSREFLSSYLKHAEQDETVYDLVLS